MFRQRTGRRRVIQSILATLLVLAIGTGFVVSASGCDRYPVRVALRRVSNGERVAVSCGRSSYCQPVSSSNDPWVDTFTWANCRKLVAFTDFVFLVDIDLPMEAGNAHNSIRICDEHLGWRDAQIKVYAIDMSATRADGQTPSWIAEFPITTELPKEGRIVVAPQSGGFPPRSLIVLALDLGSCVDQAASPPMNTRVAYLAMIATVTA